MSRRGGFARVTRRIPCPVCGKPDNCSVSEDGKWAVCGRVIAGAHKVLKNGAGLHLLRDESDERRFRAVHIVKSRPKPNGQPETYLAAVDHRQAVYTALLDGLTLNKQHADDLLRRGLHDTSTAHNLFASVPSPLIAEALTARLAAHVDLHGVPGFYKETGEWRLNVSDWHAGYFVPVRDLAQRIQALQIRRNEGEPRYCWLSSIGKLDGVTSGAPLHFAAPHRLKSGTAIITEGALKAEVIAQFTETATIGLAGVGNFKPGFGSALKSLGVERVQIAYDADWRGKPNVRHELEKLGRLLSSAGLAASVLSWDLNKGKGLDDVLLREVA